MDQVRLLRKHVEEINEALACNTAEGSTWQHFAG